MKTRQISVACHQGARHEHIINEVTDISEAKHGDVFRRLNSGHDLRVMFIAYGTNDGHGWAGICLTDETADGPRLALDWVEDGWEQVE